MISNSSFHIYVSMVMSLAWLALTFQSTLVKNYDISYGVYIYGFVVQQLYAENFPGWGLYQAFLPMILTTGFFAYLSWHFIESPSINLFKKLTANFS